MSVHVIIQARMTSQRLPGKVLENIEGMPMLWHVVNRVTYAKHVDKVILAIPDNTENDILEKTSEKYAWHYVRGNEENVLMRFYETFKAFPSDVIVRITADCPLIDPQVLDMMLEAHFQGEVDYTANSNKRTFPRGLDIEIFNADVLKRANTHAQKAYEREHVTPYIYEHPEIFTLQDIEAPKDLQRPDIRLTVDTKEDLLLVREIYKHLYKEGEIFLTKEVINLFIANPYLLKINAMIEQKKLK
ncbi:MAG: hypothetical protein A3C04_01805 [Candidatus Wildermuthbacteria bacterium RIFCSPHIGHO2_02_FULL_45_25]|uniref:Acylneuraminate cytidylyltransferase n=1 Tax=Candidatus Wildermuthbacteria bacterium RIFCSPHIGHO2_02_FULL_45_25 TaxID=1802450 RepID=A0A1G2R3E1_9BACT|nr:MAG: hypothetical protein A3C04_01805 [Candidatus Wildermuthbacteria bacterium RIFCSPHIGHO2_02_FULL_45_25]